MHTLRIGPIITGQEAISCVQRRLTPSLPPECDAATGQTTAPLFNLRTGQEIAK